MVAEALRRTLLLSRRGKHLRPKPRATATAEAGGCQKATRAHLANRMVGYEPGQSKARPKPSVKAFNVTRGPVYAMRINRHSLCVLPSWWSLELPAVGARRCAQRTAHFQREYLCKVQWMFGPYHYHPPLYLSMSF